MFETGIYKASGMQRQFWILNQLYPESSAYNIILCFKVKGPIDLKTLEMALYELFKRHDIFRMSFYLSGNELFFNINKDFTEFNLIEIVDLKSKEYSEIPQELIKEVRNPFLLDSERPARVKLFQLKSDLQYLTITMHHIICDLRTKDIICEELSYFYNNLLYGNRIDQLPSVPSYHSYCEHYHKWINSDQYNKMIHFWSNEISKLQPLGIPTDKTRPAFSQHHGSSTDLFFSKEETSLIDEFAKDLDITSFIVLLASYSVLLNALSNNNVICIGVPLSNRRLDEFKNTAGCFVNILPIIINFDSDLTIIGLIHQIRKKLLFAHRNQELPFEVIAQLQRLPKRSDINPVFQAGYTFDHHSALQFQNTEIEKIIIVTWWLTARSFC